MTTLQRKHDGKSRQLKTRGTDVDAAFLRTATAMPLDALIESIDDGDRHAVNERARHDLTHVQEDSERGWADDGVGIFNFEHHVAHGTSTIGSRRARLHEESHDG